MTDELTKTVVLSTGVVATIRRPRGRDLIAADRIVPDRAKQQTRWIFALIAQATTIDGKPIVIEDVAEFYVNDIDAISEAMGADFLSQSAAKESSSSSSEASDSAS